MRIGTCHFYNFTAACDYYREEVDQDFMELGLTPEPIDYETYVRLKMETGEVEIGAPPIAPGETLGLDSDRRYYIEVL